LIFEVGVAEENRPEEDAKKGRGRRNCASFALAIFDNI
jgi:hypothetical protein